MFQKAALVICSIFIFSSLSIAKPAGSDGSKCTMPDCKIENCDGKCPAMMAKKGDFDKRKEKMDSMKKDFMEFHKQLADLIEKYNKAKGKKKDEIKKDVTDLVTTQTEKEIAIKKEMLEFQKARVSELEKKIAEMESDKTKYVNKKVDFYLSKEGQEKIEEKKKKMEKMESMHKEMKKHGDKDGFMPPPPPPEDM